LKAAEGCRVTAVSVPLPTAEHVWSIAIADRQRGRPQVIRLAVQ